MSWIKLFYRLTINEGVTVENLTRTARNVKINYLEAASSVRPIIKPWMIPIEDLLGNLELEDETRKTSNVVFLSKQELGEIIKNIEKHLTISKIEKDKFRFTGVDIERKDDCIIMSMDDYAASLTKTAHFRDAPKEEELTKRGKEKKGRPHDGMNKLNHYGKKKKKDS